MKIHWQPLLFFVAEIIGAVALSIALITLALATERRNQQQAQRTQRRQCVEDQQRRTARERQPLP